MNNYFLAMLRQLSQNMIFQQHGVPPDHTRAVRNQFDAERPNFGLVMMVQQTVYLALDISQHVTLFTDMSETISTKPVLVM